MSSSIWSRFRPCALCEKTAFVALLIRARLHSLRKNSWCSSIRVERRLGAASKSFYFCHSSQASACGESAFSTFSAASSAVLLSPRVCRDTLTWVSYLLERFRLQRDSLLSCRFALPVFPHPGFPTLPRCGIATCEGQSGNLSVGH